VSNNEKGSGPSLSKGGEGLLPAFLGIEWEKVVRVCQECGDEFESFDLGRLSRRYCDRCIEIKIEEEEERRGQAEIAKAVARYNFLVTNARIPKKWRNWTFENSDLSINKVAFKMARKYAEEFSPDSGTLVLYSKGNGCGKTHLAACTGNYVLHRLLREVRFMKARDLLLQIRSTFSEKGGGTEADILDQVLSAELLILDDIGIDSPSPWVESTYWTVFDRRLEWELPTIVTTIYPMDSEGESLGDRIGYGALSRLVEMCNGEFIDMSGPDLR